MKQIYPLLLCFFLAAQLSAQRAIVVSKVTATWCPRCGDYGWDFMEGLKDIYSANGAQALPLGVHYSGDLENPVARWFSDNLKSQGQPQFFVGNDFISVSSGNWSDQLSSVQTMVEAQISGPSNAEMEFVSSRIVNDDGSFTVNVKVGQMANLGNDHYLAVYVFENDVVARQSSRTNEENHPNVLRDVISNNNFGDLYVASGDTREEETLTFNYTPDDSFNQDNLGVLAIMWEKDGDDYYMDYSIASMSWKALTSTRDIIADNVSMLQSADNITLSSTDTDTYQVQVVNQSGQLLDEQQLNQKLIINTAEYFSGLYFINVSKNNSVENFKVFIK